MPLKPVGKILVSDGILDQLRELVVSGEFGAGYRLPCETEMAHQLSASRSSLREALNALVHLGYLERRQKGIYVAPERRWQTNLSIYSDRSPEELSVGEMIEVRRIVETQLCGLAAKRAQPEDIKSLEEHLQEMKAQLNDPETFIIADQQFHLCVAKTARNSILGNFINGIRDVLRSSIALVIQRSTISNRSLRYHQQIFEAIRDGDAFRARRAMEGHIKDIEREFVKILYQRSASSESAEIRVEK